MSNFPDYANYDGLGLAKVFDFIPYTPPFNNRKIFIQRLWVAS